MINIHARRLAALLAAAVLAASSGCSLDKDATPGLSGPSEFGLSVTLSATPDQVPRDGSSQSVVTVTVRDSANQPVGGQRLMVSASIGTVSQSEIVTGSDGRASFAFTAPAASVPGASAVIRVTPVSTDANSAVARTVSILLTGTTNTTTPTPDFDFSPASPVLRENVVFDATPTTDEGAECEDACTYAWDFGGEATATGRIVNYRFQTVRIYPVKLTVTDAAGSVATLTQNVTVTQGTAPTASFNFTPTSPAQFETVNFTAEASRVGVAGRTIIDYDWRFGDGFTGSGMRVTHDYNVLGTYVVTLTVTDSAGVQGTTTQNVTIVNGVTALFTISPTNPARTDRITFNAEESKGSDTGFGGRNPIVKYTWHFGVDNQIVETTSPIISRDPDFFPAARTYTVTLTVEDSAGRRQTTSKTITVT